MLQDSNLQLVITSKTNKGCRRYSRDSSLVFSHLPITTKLPSYIALSTASVVSWQRLAGGWSAS